MKSEENKLPAPVLFLCDYGRLASVDRRRNHNAELPAKHLQEVAGDFGNSRASVWAEGEGAIWS